MLGEIGGTAVNVLMETLRHPDEYVRYTAAVALGNTGDERAVQPLIQSLEDTKYSPSAGNRVCDGAAKALEQIGTAEAHAALAEWRKN
jgi:HEAT repeat protein